MKQIYKLNKPKLIISILCSVYCLLSTATAVEQGKIAVSGKLDRETATIGDIVNYTVTLTYPKTLKLELPEKTDTLGQWTLKDMQQAQKEDGSNLIHDVNFVLTTYTTGTVVIPELVFNISDGGNRKQQIKTQAVNFTIESVLAKCGEACDIRDIKPPLGLRTPLWLIIFRLLLLAAAAYGAYYWYKRYKLLRAQAEPLEPDVPRVPPDQTALEELEKLKNSGLVAEGRIKEFYIALADIIRNYISAEYSIDTLDKTTAEIVGALRARQFDKKLVFDMKDFFDECDLVKFAKYQPDEKLCMADIDNAVNIVKVSGNVVP